MTLAHFALASINISLTNKICYTIVPSALLEQWRRKRCFLPRRIKGLQRNIRQSRWKHLACLWSLALPVRSPGTKCFYLLCRMLRWSPLFSILLTHEGSHREAYRDFQPSLTSSAGGAKGCSDYRFRAPQPILPNCQLCINTEPTTSIGRLIKSSQL